MAETEHTRVNAKERMKGALHRFDLNEQIEALRNEDAYRNGQMNQMTLERDNSLRVALFVFRAGGGLRDHRTRNPISVQALRGRIVFATEEGAREELTEGQLVTLSGGVTHSVEALEDSVMLLTVAAQES